MKDKLKSLMKNKVFLGCTAGALVLAIVMTAILLLPNGKTELPAEPETSDTAASDTVPDIDTPDTPPVDTSEPEETESILSDITVEVGADTGNASADVETGGKAEVPVAPVEVKEPEKPADTDNGGSGSGISIGNPPVEESYSCGCEHHHCQNADVHAYIQNLELEGCPTCGSHSCPSFYATDEWGGATIDYTKCPQFSADKDPAKYCQVCGREMWSQSNPTGCFSYLQDTQCECGELVKGNTCHHH